MTTIIIDNPVLEKIIQERNYSQEDVQKKFLFFVQQEFGIEKINLYEISVNDLWKESQNRLKNIEKLNFVNY